MLNRTVTEVIGLFSLALVPSSVAAHPKGVSFSRAAETIEAYDFVEVAAQVEGPDVPNPFIDAALVGFFGKAGEDKRKEVAGFCDSADGSMFRIRYMPSSPGDYAYSVTYRQNGFETMHTGTFQVPAGRRRGPLRVDRQNPWHFIWEGTGEHYF